MIHVDTKRARKIPDALWNVHRDTIVGLYQGKELQGDDGVIACMIRTHNFKASKAQYEYQLKKWRVRKNLKREQWKAAINIHTNRERQGKRSKIVIDGIAISEERLIRERARYGCPRPTTLIAASNSGPSGRVMVFSPPPSPLAIEFTQVMQIGDIMPDPDVNSGQAQMEIVRHTSPLVEELHVPESALMLPSFSWMTTLDWSMMEKLTNSTRDLIKRPTSLPTDCMAYFYQTHHVSIAYTRTNADTIFAQYLVFALLNNIQPSSKTDLDDVHKWLRCLPEPVVLQFFKALPAGHSDVLRERVFIAAMVAGDVATVQSMLALGLDPSQTLNIDHGNRGPSLPLEIALVNRDFAIAETLLRHLIHKSASKLADLLNQLLNAYNPVETININHYQNPSWSELLRILLDAGGRPKFDCFALALHDMVLARRILDDHENGLLGWVQEGLLDACLRFLDQVRDARSYENLVRLIYSYLLEENIDELREHDPTVAVALWKALQSAAKIRHTWAIKMILDAGTRLNINLGDPAFDYQTNAAIMSACRDRNWPLVAHLKTTHATPLRPPPPSQAASKELSGATTGTHSDVVSIMNSKSPSPFDLWEDFMIAVTAVQRVRDQGKEFDPELYEREWEDLAHRIRNEEFPSPEDIVHELNRTIQLGCDQLTLALVAHLERKGIRHRALLRLLERANIRVISQMMSENIQFKHALSRAQDEHSFDALDDLVFRKCMSQTESIFLGGMSLESSLGQRVMLHALAFHAIYSGDDSLLDWLLENGLSTCELYVASSHENSRVTSVLERSSSEFEKRKTSSWDIITRFPSLLSVAAANDHAGMVRYLLENGAKHTDSFALMRAVNCNSSTEVFEQLLEKIDSKAVMKRSSYGAAALRAAIFKKDYEKMCLILPKANIDGIECLEITTSKGKISKSDPLSPLGEAILCRDLKAAEILIENHVNLNGLVTFADYGSSGLMNSRGTIMRRASPLLAAIDFQELPMVRLLVEHGADIDHPPRLGLLRTPLQRAAEIGSFDIVQYLLERGASVDSAPCYSGGTPLQLAALGGYVGIATLLFEKGANVNHLPAEGQGRTALEAAVEWSRVDMMSLLVSWNVNFDLVVDEEGRSQYERAVEFAEKRAQWASKRFIERLRKESWVAFLDPEAY